MNYLQMVCLLNAGLEDSRSNLVFETRDNFIVRMLYCQIIMFKVKMKPGLRDVQKCNDNNLLTFIAET